MSIETQSSLWCTELPRGERIEVPTRAPMLSLADPRLVMRTIARLVAAIGAGGLAAGLVIVADDLHRLGRFQPPHDLRGLVNAIILIAPVPVHLALFHALPAAMLSMVFGRREAVTIDDRRIVRRVRRGPIRYSRRRAIKGLRKVVIEYPPRMDRKAWRLPAAQRPAVLMLEYARRRQVLVEGFAHRETLALARRVRAIAASSLDARVDLVDLCDPRFLEETDTAPPPAHTRSCVTVLPGEIRLTEKRRLRPMRRDRWLCTGTIILLLLAAAYGLLQRLPTYVALERVRVQTDVIAVAFVVGVNMVVRMLGQRTYLGFRHTGERFRAISRVGILSSEKSWPRQDIAAIFAEWKTDAPGPTRCETILHLKHGEPQRLASGDPYAMRALATALRSALNVPAIPADDRCESASSDSYFRGGATVGGKVGWN